VKSARGLTVLALAAAMTVGAGCSLTGKSPTPAPERPRVAQRMPQAPRPAPNMAPGRTARPVGMATMTRVKSVAKTDPKVKDAYVVIMPDKTAMVGLVLKGNETAAEVTGIEKTVARKVESLKSVRKAYVSANADVVTRVKKVASGVAQGKPLAALKSETTQLMTRMAPKT
jgi:YhcN/YlaJ family sporulation lipoprotein